MTLEPGQTVKVVKRNLDNLGIGIHRCAGWVSSMDVYVGATFTLTEENFVGDSDRIRWSNWWWDTDWLVPIEEIVALDEHERNEL